MTIEARRAIRVPISDVQHVTFMLADLPVNKKNKTEQMITVMYEDAAGEAAANVMTVEEAEAKLRTLYPGQAFAAILSLLQKTPRKETPVKRIITDLN